MVCAICSKSCGLALWAAPEKRWISSAAAARESRARCSPSISSAPSSWCTGLSSDASSSRFPVSRKKASRTCSIVRRLARISETTWFMSSRSCALRDISSSKGISGALRRSLPRMQSSRRERRSCACWANSLERCAKPASAFSNSRSAVATSSATASLMFSRLEVSHAATSATSPASAVRSALPSRSASPFNAVAQLFGVEILGQCLVREGIEEGERYPPKGALRSRTLYRLDRIDGGAHFFGPAGIVLEPLEESALVAAALLAQVFVRFGRLRCARKLVTLGRAESEIRIVEICRIGMPAPRCNDIAVQGIEPEGLIGVARHQLVEVGADSVEGALDQPEDLVLP